MKEAVRNIFGKSTLILGGLAVAVPCAATLSTSVYADNDTVVDDVTITIPVSCSMAGVGMDSHVATNLHNDMYEPDIGTSTFTVTCNDNSGFSIYAVGFSNDTYGNTKMISTSDSTNYYDTGVHTSSSSTSVSTWSMKLAATGTSYIPTITDGYGAYHAVPSTYTKVVTYLSNTDAGDNASGSKFTTTYDTYISRTQTAGTYTGQVKYTLVHPNNAAAPSQ